MERTDEGKDREEVKAGLKGGTEERKTQRKGQGERHFYT